MEKATMEDVQKMVAPCHCGSGKPYYQCHGVEEAKMMENKECPVHAGSMLKDCCMKHPQEHQA